MVSVVREQYLRTDLCCQSQLCDKCRESSISVTSSLLPEDVSHYLIPFVDVAGHYIDLLELEQLTGIIMLQTVVNVVKFAQGGVYRRLLNKIVRQVGVKCRQLLIILDIVMIFRKFLPAVTC